jgi:hypothetical protein
MSGRPVGISPVDATAHRGLVSESPRPRFYFHGEPTLEEVAVLGMSGSCTCPAGLSAHHVTWTWMRSSS